MELSYPSVVKGAQKSCLIKTALMSNHKISVCLVVNSMLLCHIRFCLFLRFEALCPSQQFFSSVRIIPSLPGLNKY